MNLNDKIVDIYYALKFAIWDLTDFIKAKFSKEEIFNIEKLDVGTVKSKKRKVKKKKK